ncbi:nucleotide pyrophosphatase, partial [Gardnerella vaginalis]
MLLMSIEIPSVDDLLNFVDDSCNSDLRLSAILPAVSSSIDASISTDVYNDPDTARISLGFPKSQSAVVVLVDGLGYWNLAIRKGHAPYLRYLLNDCANQRPIKTCIPSTTVAAMATF